MKTGHTAAAMVLTAAAVSIPCGAWYYLGSRQLAREAAQLEETAAREASFAARQLATRLALRLEDLRDTEGARPYLHYFPRYLSRGEGCGHVKLRSSPLAEGKRHHPVMAHLQIDAAGRVTSPRPDLKVDAADLVWVEEAGPRTLTAIAAVRLPTAHAADEVAQVEPFRWRTGRFQGRPTLFGVRQVTAGGERYTQAFAVDSGCLSHWMFDGGFPAHLRPGAPVAETDAAVPIAGAAWHVAVDAAPAMGQARTRAAALRRQFQRSFGAGALGALLAATCVVALVWRSGRLASERASFAAAAAHELRTPLAGIRLHGEMLAHALGNPDRAQSYAQRITDEADRLGRLVSNVLAHTRGEQSRLQLRPEPGDLSRTVLEALALLEPMAAAAGTALRAAVEESLPPVPFDRDAVHQIVRNLVDNAEKHTRAASDRRIEVTVRAHGEGVALEVRDHGPGVPPAARRHLFRPFSRPDPNAPSGGLGLGLSVVKTLAQGHGGDATYAETPGGGATFTVIFPRVTPA